MNPNEVNDIENKYSDFSDEESMTSGLKRSSALLMQMKKQSKTIDSASAIHPSVTSKIVTRQAV